MMIYCARCNRDFNSAAALNDHLRDSSRHHICPICGPSHDFVDAEDLEEHQDENHFSCDVCNILCDQQSDLKTHLISKHHGCRACLRSFDSSNSLKHVRTSYSRVENFSWVWVRTDVCSIKSVICHARLNASAALACFQTHLQCCSI